MRLQSMYDENLASWQVKSGDGILLEYIHGDRDDPNPSFRRVGTPGFYLTWARPALFVSTLVTNADESALRRTITNAGGQVDFRFGVLSRLELTLSAGYAAAFESGQPTRHEGMLSLKILR